MASVLRQSTDFAPVLLFSPDTQFLGVCCCREVRAFDGRENDLEPTFSYSKSRAQRLKHTKFTIRKLVLDIWARICCGVFQSFNTIPYAQPLSGT